MGFLIFEQGNSTPKSALIAKETLENVGSLTKRFQEHCVPGNLLLWDTSLVGVTVNTFCCFHFGAVEKVLLTSLTRLATMASKNVAEEVREQLNP